MSSRADTRAISREAMLDLPIAKYEGEVCVVRGFTEDARALLRAHAWPGNVRELKNAVEHAVVFAGEEVDGEHLPLTLRGERSAGEGAAAGPGGSTAAPALAAQVEGFERSLILAALKRSQGSVSTAALALHLPKRTLQYKMKALGLSRVVDYAGAAES